MVFMATPTVAIETVAMAIVCYDNGCYGNGWYDNGCYAPSRPRTPPRYILVRGGEVFL